jgi:hypothetical protein
LKILPVAESYTLTDLFGRPKTAFAVRAPLVTGGLIAAKLVECVVQVVYGSGRGNIDNDNRRNDECRK